MKTDSEEDKRKKRLFGCALFASLIIVIAGPHSHPKVGGWLKVRRWKLWRAWLNYVGFEVLADDSVGGNCPEKEQHFDVKKDQVIFAIVPHGLFPFPLALAALPDAANRAFGVFRPVVATATSLFPFVRTLLGFLGAV